MLQATEISESVLTDAFLLLGYNCTCTSDPRSLLGPTIPLIWGEQLRKQVYQERGFDPAHPGVAAALGGVWTSLDTITSQGEEAVSLPPLSPGYEEFSVQPQTKQPPGADNGSLPPGP